MNKFVISSGHAKYVSGAVDILNEVFEARRVVSKVTDYMKELGCSVVEYHDNTSRTKRDNVNGIVRYHNSKERDLDVSVHFNAGTKEIGGVEVLYLSSGNKAIAAKVSKAIAEAIGIKDRGAKKREDLGFLNGTHKPAILIEVCFVDTATNAEAYLKNFDKCCRAIAESLSGKEIKETPKPEVKPVSKPLSKPASKPVVSAKGTVKVLVDGLWFYDKADWNAKKAKVNKGEVFTVVGSLTVSGSKMYKLKSGNFITAAAQYVKYTK
ncbi:MULTISPECIES: N-acetylmuramoyl-L-alanine amidase [Peribacillus]|uniref:N-acetylmuramoyl-L-alanine amidase n=1 Tax=Peribacillus TaxID=2675229 RepID=UPI001F4EF051|nr:MULTISPECIES: N-acetylmuramoyl-L-alanine amidase [unclassified Peribacillus]MCK1985155.1 N-acetylmuramoyl-L-alanine amidase [Peribacillus sp. Aquil_B1]MCK2007195.1 N-acetylmuramoyl-L-alanine amidase [Peribacillus sp. Aquil_B8]